MTPEVSTGVSLRIGMVEGGGGQTVVKSERCRASHVSPASTTISFTSDHPDCHSVLTIVVWCQIQRATHSSSIKKPVTAGVGVQNFRKKLHCGSFYRSSSEICKQKTLVSLNCVRLWQSGPSYERILRLFRAQAAIYCTACALGSPNCALSGPNCALGLAPR